MEQNFNKYAAVADFDDILRSSYYFDLKLLLYFFEFFRFNVFFVLGPSGLLRDGRFIGDEL